ncbi:MAG: RrF2 family transcriptional regulator [Chloroflexota bacterium]
MKLSTRVRYGMRALVDLSAHYGEPPQLIREIARRQGISQHYLEQIIIVLKSAGLVKSIRGAKGGIILAKAPSQIKLSDVMKVLEGSTAPVECVDDAGVCIRSPYCVMRDVWSEMKDAINGVLEARTLQEMVDRQGYGAD